MTERLTAEERKYVEWLGPQMADAERSHETPTVHCDTKTLRKLINTAEECERLRAEKAEVANRLAEQLGTSLAWAEQCERLRAALDRIALSDNYWTHGDIVRLAEEAIK